MDEKLTKKLDLFLLEEMERQTKLLNNLVEIKDQMYMNDDDKEYQELRIKWLINYRKNLFRSFDLPFPVHEDIFWEKFIEELKQA